MDITFVFLLILIIVPFVLTIFCMFDIVIMDGDLICNNVRKKLHSKPATNTPSNNAEQDDKHLEWRKKMFSQNSYQRYHNDTRQRDIICKKLDCMIRVMSIRELTEPYLLQHMRLVQVVRKAITEKDLSLTPYAIEWLNTLCARYNIPSRIN